MPARSTIPSIFLVFTILLGTTFITLAQAPLRRPLSPSSPMLLWQVYPDTEDPQADINAVPPDVRPYTVMMYAEHGAATNGLQQADYFCNVCQQNGMWCMIQCSSGVTINMNPTNSADYEALYQKYPNLIGFCLCEQDWGFLTDWPVSFTNRCALYVKLLQLGSQYGGYLYVNEMECYGGNQSENCVGKMKTYPSFAAATITYKTNYIIGNKFTEAEGYYDNESCCLGEYLSGHAGNYAIRFDEFAWGWSGKAQLFGPETPVGQTVTNWGDLPLFGCPETAQGIPLVDHLMLQGATLIDGPEVPQYTTCNAGRMMMCYTNTIVDIFRKVLDSTIQIPSFTNVLAHTPVAYVSDVDNEVTGDFYDGLYMMDGDGNTNRTWFKRTGRYFSVPEVYTNAAYEMSFFKTNVLESQQSTRWPTMMAKTNEFNSYFPSEYTVTAATNPFFAERRDNRWFTYNPWINSNVITSASIPLQHNTCSNLFLQYAPHTFAVIAESSQSLQIYFNDYYTDLSSMYATTNLNVAGYINTSLFTKPSTNNFRTNIFQISGCTNASSPIYTLNDRGFFKQMSASSTYNNGTFTLTVVGNGLCDITISNCSGSATRTGSIPANNVMVAPANYVPGTPAPPVTLSATPGPAQATLSWHATNCLYYNIKRATSVNGPFVNIATGITNAVNSYFNYFNSGRTVYNTSYNYTDSGVTVSNTYYYVVSAVNTSGEGSNSLPAVVTIIPTSVATTNIAIADSYVQDSASTSNFGTATNLWVKNSSGASVRSTYLMFDVHALTNVQSATVTLSVNRVDAAATMYYEVASTNWTETGITWANQPGGTGVFLYTNIVSTPGAGAVFDVTAAASAAATNGGLLALRITQQANSGNTLIQYCSREFPTNSYRPALAYTSSTAFGTSPTGLVAGAISSGQINLSWLPASGANYYNLRRSTSSSGPFTLVAQGIMVTNYVDTGLTSRTPYFYAVTAVYSGGESANSLPAAATTFALPAPVALNATLSANLVSLNWPPVNGSVGYDVKRSLTSGGPYTTIATGVSGTNYTDAVNNSSTSFYYVVTGVDGGGEGTNSPEASVTTPVSLTMVPTDDAYVEDGSSSNSNFGTSPFLKVKNQGPGTTFTRITYLKFYVRALTNVPSVKLVLTPYQVDGAGVTNAFELVTNDNWSETNITWAGQPGGSGIILTNMRGASYAVGVPVTVDVTSWIASQATNDGYLSLRITDPNTNATLIGFWSKESGTPAYNPALQFVNPGNNPPTLAPVASQTVNAGMVLMLTNAASDPNLPAQSLFFTLLAAPTNATLTTINPTNAVFAWRPMVGQAGTTNQVAIEVTDNGSPGMSATNNFTVTVNPLGNNPSISSVFSSGGGTFQLSISGPTGPDYTILNSTDLFNWQPMWTSNAPVTPFLMTITNLNDAAHFYRIQIGP